ncbi:uncharacterized protein ACOB8E_023905 isoform 1-T2 [Sarcophilus harrisii]
MEVKDLIITCENKMQTELDPIYPQLVKRCSLLSSLDLPGEMPLDLLKQEKAQISPRNSSRHFSAQNDIDYAQIIQNSENKKSDSHLQLGVSFWNQAPQRPPGPAQVHSIQCLQPLEEGLRTETEGSSGCSSSQLLPDLGPQQIQGSGAYITPSQMIGQPPDQRSSASSPPRRSARSHPKAKRRLSYNP